jgi:ribonuclease BN (tRNA processing enzyme)
VVEIILVTPLHADHFGGLPFFSLDGQFGKRHSPLMIDDRPGVRERLAKTMELLFLDSSVMN